MVYLRCRNCGCYLLNSKMRVDGYCSEVCAEQYHTCINCGRHYRADMGYGGRYCRPECAVQYKLSRYPGAAAIHGLLKELG